jgi:cytoskeleton-associated protein 5
MAEEEDFSSLPLPDRFTHKNWKVRKEGYEASAKIFDLAQSENDPDVRQFINDASLWKGAVGDSNVAAQQEALGALISFLNIAGVQGCTRYVWLIIRISRRLRAVRWIYGSC